MRPRRVIKGFGSVSLREYPSIRNSASVKDWVLTCRDDRTDWCVEREQAVDGKSLLYAVVQTQEPGQYSSFLSLDIAKDWS